LRYNFAADTFYIMKLCSRLFILYCRNCPKDDKFEEVRGGVEPWLMARWKARVRVDFLLTVIELLFLSLTVEAIRFYSVRNVRIASAVLATAIPSVCLSVRHTPGIVSKRRHVAWCSLHRWIAKCV